MNEHDLKALRIARDALDTAPQEREDFVSQRCGADTTLRERVAGLLRGIAERGAIEASSARADDDIDPLPGTTLGAFRVAERIGRGGMGVVYRGTREGADFSQDVALKLIRRGFDFDDIRTRFLRERRILARLDHPNLARFIDGGVAPDGRPWFALEFVRGEPIARWCDAHALDLRARVTLFLDVCAAVQYAHAQLVVHRDLKPANILVDGDGRVRLLDFGLAGLLAEDEPREATTIAGRRALTPEYAAPEVLAGERAGVAADVYALGVTLYQLLADALPREIDRLAGNLATDTAHLPLAQAIARDPAMTAKRLAARSTSLRAFRGDVRGDLARIVDKALADTPGRRYDTVQSFADDLRRWLAGAPVRVSGNGLGYRLGKFLRRHRVAAAAAAAVLATLGAFGVYHVRTLNDGLARTTTERNRAEASLRFLEKLLSSPNPQFGAGADLKLGDFLNGSVATLRDDTTLDASARDDLRVTIAGSLKSLDRYDEGLAIAREVATSRASDAHGWTARVRAGALAGEILVLKGEYEPALVELDSAQQLADAHEVDDPTVLAMLLTAQSIANNHLARWEESERFIDRAVALLEPIREAKPELYANLLDMASIPRGYPKRDFDGAERLLRQALAFLDAHGLGGSGEYWNSHGNLAQTLMLAGKFEQAEPMMLEGIEHMRQIYGANNRETSFKLSDLAFLYYRWNHLADARRWQDEATAAMTAALGETHPFVALTLSHSADIAFHAGDLARAAAEARIAAANADGTNRVDFERRRAVFEAALRCDNGDASAATDLLAQVAELPDALNPRTVRTRVAAATCLVRRGRSADAQSVIAPLAQHLAQSPPTGKDRNDFYQPALERVRAAMAQAGH